ncbi:unnamed protein product [Wuchereria bancrofti]|uniref:Small ribosomal subunit protein uS9 n=1 Tax=Wuchereria bancrofti TaxID=6293 RepID=A0A3P7FSJ1_WUCBA|nr:unnamed protein product [Wuchereria bancrofti]
MLKLVAVYVSKPDISQLKLFLQQILPSNVEQLILYDESYRIAYQIEQELNELKCKIHFCRDDDIIIDSYWMNGKSELITHTLWKPPYKINTSLPATLPEWYCVLSELMETALISESSCRSLSSADTARNISQYIDECTDTDHSASCTGGNERVQALYSVQDKTLKHCKPKRAIVCATCGWSKSVGLLAYPKRRDKRTEANRNNEDGVMGHIMGRGHGSNHVLPASIMVVTQSVQVFGRKKTATAVAYCKKGRGLIKVNGRPLEHIQPEILRIKLQVYCI